MFKKIGLLAVFIIIALIVFGFVYQDFSVKEVDVGETRFMVPSEYQVQNISNTLVKLTSGGTVYFINEKNSSDIKIFVNKYVNHKNKTENKSVEISHLAYNDSDIYKSVVSDNSSVIHYWFVKNGKGYEIYTGTANSNSDELVLDIINS
ncbi:MAG: hypothetical protein UIB63_03730 [Methanobrevibacter sp.]|uniref:hypothetical protein n=1 Tax=Methanobrevibacter sp. TaxID=66852 RepID=UPI002E787FA5|nr:hypothetical protein [Methanobrevibacter sp.]MEE0942207.1 hypothetical protein [Methanobrevibacter sp.]